MLSSETPKVCFQSYGKDASAMRLRNPLVLAAACLALTACHSTGTSGSTAVADDTNYAPGGVVDMVPVDGNTAAFKAAITGTCQTGSQFVRLTVSGLPKGAVYGIDSNSPSSVHRGKPDITYLVSSEDPAPASGTIVEAKPCTLLSRDLIYVEVFKKGDVSDWRAFKVASGSQPDLPPNNSPSPNRTTQK